MNPVQPRESIRHCAAIRTIRRCGSFDSFVRERDRSNEDEAKHRGYRKIFGCSRCVASEIPTRLNKRLARISTLLSLACLRR